MRMSRCLVVVILVGLVAWQWPQGAEGCCGIGPRGSHVVNADQTVILIWDPVTKTEHFIRKATFKSDAKDFGFLIPTPTAPESAEAGEAAFPFLARLTEPVINYVKRGADSGCGCSKSKSVVKASSLSVRVVEEKTVAGFRLAVLEAKTASSLVGWLKDHGYPFSPEVEAWARPYIDAGWMVTALKVAPEGERQDKVSAASLRLSFKTERPLFPYREPESTAAANALGAKERLLRIFFITDSRYQGELTKDQPWTGKTAWSGKLTAQDRKTLLGHLNLPETTGPQEFWLTEFEDHWPYRVAPADLYFARASDQSPLRRPPVTEYVQASGEPDVLLLAFFGGALVPLARRRRQANN
jgi:hypothetical protein